MKLHNINIQLENSICECFNFRLNNIIPLQCLFVEVMSFGASKLAHDTHMSTWTSWKIPFDSSSFTYTL